MATENDSDLMMTFLIAMIIAIAIVLVACRFCPSLIDGFKVNSDIESEKTVDAAQKKALISGRSDLMKNATKMMKPLGFSMSKVNIMALASGEYIVKAKCERKVQKFDVEAKLPAIDLKDASAAGTLVEAIRNAAKQL